MQQLMEPESVVVPAIEEMVHHIKLRLRGSLQRLERAIEQCHVRHAQQKEAFAEELEGYLQQLKLIIDEEGI